MKNILLVEDSPMFGKLTKKKIESAFDVPVYWMKTLAETKKLLEKSKGDFSCALLDYNLPDAPHGEIIDLVLEKGITSFVFTTNVTEEVREKVWSKKVADYILKEDPNSLDYIITAIKEIQKNQEILVLIVDDSRTARTMLSELLYVKNYRVINAKSGEDALKILDQYPNIQLVITDYNMPRMDGYLLCQKIRQKFKADRLAIIGISSEEDRSIGARFIKSGANDFVIKQSFLVEELYSRIKECLETIDLFSKLRKAATCDFLTGLFNRRYFFEKGGKLLESYKKDSLPIACTILDIDHFKHINDNYGHNIGDKALQGFANILMKNASELELIARIGGEEFCMLTPGLDLSNLIDRFESLRLQIESTPATTLPNGSPLKITASIGICAETGSNLDDMIKKADNTLYKAKSEGKNCIRYS